eukprot:5605781-Pleurochrysis_carterae.AAC.1
MALSSSETILSTALAEEDEPCELFEVRSWQVQYLSKAWKHLILAFKTSVRKPSAKPRTVVWRV